MNLWESEENKNIEHADYILESARTKPEKLIDLNSGNTKWRSLYQKLIDLYIEESKREPTCKNLVTTSHLLDKLVKKEHLNTLVLNLYPGNEGYTLMLKGKNGTDSETIKLPYEESEFLDYIDNEELPPLLVDLIDKAQANLFYSGCVILELRDYRRSTNNSFDTRHILLKPSQQSFLCDINAITNDGYRWTPEDKFNLESQLLLHTSDALCLDPSPVVFFVTNRLNHERQKLNSYGLKRSVKKYSQAAVNRKRKMAQCPAPKYLKLHDFVSKKKDRMKANPPVNLRLGKSCVDLWRQKDVHLDMPQSIDVDKYAKVVEKPKLSMDNTPVTVEEYTLETERAQGKVYFTKLTIKQRLSDVMMIGELYVDKDYTEGENKGSTCSFQLGSRANVDKYIKQFREIFTEEGRRAVKITHYKPGQPPLKLPQSLPSGGIAQVQAHHPIPGTQALITQAANLAATLQANQGVDAKKQRTFSLTLGGPTGSITPNLTSPQGAVPPSQSPSGSGNLNPLSNQTLQLQQQLGAQRLKQMGIYSNLHRPGSPSSVTTPVGQPSQLPSYSQATQMTGSAPTTPTGQGSMAQKLSTPSPSTRISTGAVRVSEHIESATSSPITSTAITVTQENVQQGQLPGNQPISSPQANVPAPNINIANFQNINIASIQGLSGLTNLQGLQNVQVSLTNVPGGITVPLSMINTGSTLSAPGGIIVSSFPGVQPLSTAVTSTPGSKTEAVNASGLSTTQTLVTMVTGIPQSTSTPSTAQTSTVTSSGVITSALPGQAGGMVSVPIQNLQQFMAANVKNTQGIRAGTPLSLLQIPSQLLTQANLPPGTRVATPQTLQQLPNQTKGQIGVAGQNVTYTQFQAAPLQRPGAPQGLNQQQLMFSPTLIQKQHLLQYKQQQQQQQQLQQQQQQQQQPQTNVTPKSKSKKRTSSTPPKT